MSPFFPADLASSLTSNRSHSRRVRRNSRESSPPLVPLHERSRPTLSRPSPRQDPATRRSHRLRPSSHCRRQAYRPPDLLDWSSPPCRSRLQERRILHPSGVVLERVPRRGCPSVDSKLPSVPQGFVRDPDEQGRPASSRPISGRRSILLGSIDARGCLAVDVLWIELRSAVGGQGSVRSSERLQRLEGSRMDGSG